MDPQMPLFFQDSFLGTLLRIVVTVIATQIVVQIIGALWRRWERRMHPRIQYKFLYHAVLIFVYVTGILIAITQIRGADTVIEKLIVGSGFIALAIGLAAQESLGNVINGIVLAAARPFEVGDRIRLVNGNITGFVENITLRHTVMRTFTNTRVIIPNSTINKDMIENSHYQTSHASGFIDATITFDSDIDRAMEIIASVIGNHPKYLDRRVPEQMESPKVTVYVRELGINGVMLRASMWTEDVNENFDACSEVRYQIKKEFDLAGILLAQVPARPECSAHAGMVDESGN